MYSLVHSSSSVIQVVEFKYYVNESKYVYDCDITIGVFTRRSFQIKTENFLCILAVDLHDNGTLSKLQKCEFAKTVTSYVYLLRGRSIEWWNYDVTL